MRLIQHIRTSALAPWLVSATLFLAGLAYTNRPAETPAQACGMPPNPPVPVDATEITVMGKADHRDCWQVQMAVAAAPLVKGYKLGVRTRPLLMNDDPMWLAMSEAASLGRSADIVALNYNTWETFLGMDALAPLDDCVSRYTEFQNIRPDAWSVVQTPNHVWAVPLAADTQSTLFFSKIILRRLGWSEAQIADLPKRVLEGRFSRDDMDAIAREADQRGLVRPGFGVWAGEDAGWNFKTPRRDARVVGQVLFWDWNNLAWGEYLMKLGGPDDLKRLYDTIGYALSPNEHSTASPVVVQPKSYSMFYAITSDKANGNRHHQKEACALLATMSTPEMNDRHIAHAGYLSVMTRQALPDARFGHDIMRMIDDANRIYFGRN